ncbi:MAG: hypothetical protein A2096_09355 [Spirochaetes bacterium GWF1_41_5]|nr:MAG: hypothetical protein A2096_09355 [Spirochaetes bacterium GWF1_41_5]HBE01718.1 hypothetical protein [Spirochaetia bacterium]
MKITFNQQFDSERMRQYINQDPSVLHCHHYATLYTKLALDMQELQAPRLLSESMEEAMYTVFKKYFVCDNISSLQDKIKVTEEIFRLTGLGLLEIRFNSERGSAVMKHSHLDEGWIKKWGHAKHPVNFTGQGYIAAAFAVISDEWIGSYEVKEIKSIVCGDSFSEFSVQKKDGRN